MNQALNLRRPKFGYDQQVTWQIVQERIYHSREFQIHLYLLLIAFFFYMLLCKWTNMKSFFKDIRLINGQQFVKKSLNPYNTFLIMSSSAFIAIVFSKGSHRQYYLWYYFVLPFLLDLNEDVPMIVKYILFFIIDFSYAYIYYVHDYCSIACWIVFVSIMNYIIMKPR